MGNQREGHSFTFSRSLFEAVLRLEERDQLPTLIAIIDYGLNGVYDEQLKGPQGAVFHLAVAYIDTLDSDL